jgi:hypothetical protein
MNVGTMGPRGEKERQQLQDHLAHRTEQGADPQPVERDEEGVV